MLSHSHHHRILSTAPQLECTNEWLIDTDSINALHAAPLISSHQQSHSRSHAHSHASTDSTNPSSSSSSSSSSPRPLVYWTTDAGWCARLADGTHAVYPRPPQRQQDRSVNGNGNGNDNDSSRRGRHQSPPSHALHRSASVDHNHQHHSTSEGACLLASNCAC